MEPKTHYSTHNIPLSDPVLSYLDPAHILILDVSMTQFNILLSTSRSPWRFSDQILYVLFISSMGDTSSTHLILTILSEEHIMTLLSM